MSQTYPDSLKSIGDDFPSVEHYPFKDALSRGLGDAYNRLRSRAIELEKVAVMVARLNPNAGEIGDGMLRNIVQAAREALNP